MRQPASSQLFANRRAAGAALAHALCALNLPRPIVVIGLPRGGIPVAYEVAQALSAPLDALIVRKVATPGMPEVAIGALAVGDVLVRDGAASTSWGDQPLSFERLAAAERPELERREHAYRAGSAPLHFDRETVVLVDDGLATGCTMLAAVRAARKAGARTIVAAAPVSSKEAAVLVGLEVESLVILKQPANLQSVGQWYQDFDQVEDLEVQALLERSRRTTSADMPPR